jgi:hypothetical protein
MEGSAPSQPQPRVGLVVDAARRTESLSSRRLLPSPFVLNSTASIESFLVRGEDASNVAVNSITPPAYDYKPNPETLLQQTFAVSRRAEQLRLRKEQRIVATAEDSVLRTEMGDPESQEENVPACFGISRWCGSVRSGPSAGMRLGLPVSGRPSPLLWVRRLQPLLLCRPQYVAANGLGLMPWVIISTRVPPILGPWAVEQLADHFRTTHKIKTQQVARSLWRH